MFRTQTRTWFAGLLFLSALTVFGQGSATLVPGDTPPMTAGQVLSEHDLKSFIAKNTHGTIFFCQQQQVSTPTGLCEEPLTNIPTWLYATDASQDHKIYFGRIVGGDPTSSTATTIVSVPVFPIILTLVVQGAGGFTWTFDPTKPDTPCLTNGQTPYNLLFESPIFVQQNWTMNGQLFPATQYHDAHLRSEFLNYPGSVTKTADRIRLAPIQYPALNLTVVIPSLAAYQSLNIYDPTGGSCGGVPVYANATNPPSAEGYIPVNGWSAYGQNGLTFDQLIQLWLDHNNILTSQFSLFTMYKSVFLGAYGYHADTADGHTYAIADFEENSSIFSGEAKDVQVATHEVAEWIHDPFITFNGTGFNGTPPYGNLYPTIAGCQDDFEVGDPLNGVTIPVVVSTSPPFTYHMQELAYFDAFYGGNSSTTKGVYTSLYGAGGFYSSNGTLTSPFALCPPGGLEANSVKDGSFEPPPTAGGGLGTGFVTETPPTTFGGFFGVDWTVGGPTTANIDVYSDAELWPYAGAAYNMPLNVVSGHQAVDLTGSADLGQADYISQNVATTSGQKYTLYFWVGAVYGDAGPASLKVQIGTASPITVTNNNATAANTVSATPPVTTYWGLYVIDFTATGSSTTIKFINNSAAGVHICGLDAVSVSPQI